MVVYFAFRSGIGTARRCSSEDLVDRIDKMRLFVRVVETGSFSAAAKAEGVTQPTVSKEVSSLETRLGVQLLRRSPRGLSVTEPGREYYDFAVGMLADLEAAEARVRAGKRSPQGRLRVACPHVFSDALIVPALGALLDAHPALTVDLDVSERYVSLVEEGIDVAIRIGELADSALIARQVGCLEPVVVASPAYLAAHGTPRTPDDLRKHRCLPFLSQGASMAWRFRSAEGETSFAPTAALRTNDTASVLAAARAGFGLARGPGWIFADDLTEGTLVSVLAKYRSRLVPVHAVTSGTRRMTGAIQAFAEFVASLFAEDPHLRLR